jgi:hypothetical protein
LLRVGRHDQEAGIPERLQKFLLEQDLVFRVIPATQEVDMKDKSSQGIVLDEKAQEQPKDKQRAQTVHKSEPGHVPRQPVKEDDELQPLREKSGF